MNAAHKHNFAAIILAAGQGTRMRSAMPKVMHKLAGLPLISHVLRAVEPLQPQKTVVVVAPHMESVREAAKGCVIAVQDKQSGTGHAVNCAKEALKGYNGPVLILYGDTPLITPETLSAMLEAAQAAEIVVLGMHM